MKKKSGNTLLKSLLFIVVISAVSFGVYKYFSNENTFSDGDSTGDFNINLSNEKMLTAMDPCTFIAKRKYSRDGISYYPDPWLEVTYKWTCTLQFYVNLIEDINIKYKEENKKLWVSINTLEGSEFIDFKISEGYPKINSGNGWNERGSQPNSYLGHYLNELSKIEKMAKYSNKNGNSYSLPSWKADIVDSLLTMDKNTNRQSVLNATKLSIENTLRSAFEEAGYDLSGICFNVEIKQMKVFDEEIWI